MSYGRAGRFGVGVPQSNPTVEPEMAVLMPRHARLHVTRLTSGAAQPEARLRAYLEDLGPTLRSYDGMKLEAFGFGCTGSSYFLGPEREAQILAACERAFGYPIVTAADAIVWMLERLGARRIAMLAPYPPAMIEAARAYFDTRGVGVIAAHRVATRSADTRSIYELGAQDARTGLNALRALDADAVLISGTGMPSLPLVDPAAAPPILSSNFCLAVRLLDIAGRNVELDDGVQPKQWRARLAESLSNGIPE